MTSSDTQTIRHLQSENYRLRDEVAGMREYVGRLQRTLKALISMQHSLDHIDEKTNVYDLIHKILQSALDAVDSEDGSLMLLDEDTGDLVFVEVIGASREKLMNYRLPKGQGVAHWAVASKQVRLVENTLREPNFSPQVDQFTGVNTSSLICVPLVLGGRVLGAIEAVNTRSGRAFSDSDKELITLVGRLAAEAIYKAERAQEQAS